MAKFNAAFWKWFGDSKVVDSHGQPLVVYHGTTGPQDFFKFQKMRHPKTDPGYFGEGFYFTTDPEYAEMYAGSWGYGRYAEHGRIMPVYLSIKNPLFIPWNSKVRKITEDPKSFTARLILENFDGVQIEKDPKYGKWYEWMALYPEQIKSAIGNDGTWDAEDPDIRSNPAKRVGPAEVAEALVRADDPNHDPGWVGVLINQVLKYPDWQLITLDPKKTTNFYLPEDESEEEYLRELANVLDDLPPIVAIPDPDKPEEYYILDGAHRTAAALMSGQNIKAYIPA